MMKRRRNQVEKAKFLQSAVEGPTSRMDKGYFRKWDGVLPSLGTITRPQPPKHQSHLDGGVVKKGRGRNKDVG